MPTYEFRCEAGHTTDRFFRTINAAPAVIECPECGTSAVRQVSGGIGLVFKGSGFYITDYGKDGKKPQGSSAPDASTAGGDKPATGSPADAGAASKSESSSKPETGSSGSGSSTGDK